MSCRTITADGNLLFDIPDDSPGITSACVSDISFCVAWSMLEVIASGYLLIRHDYVLSRIFPSNYARGRIKGNARDGIETSSFRINSSRLPNPASQGSDSRWREWIAGGCFSPCEIAERVVAVLANRHAYTAIRENARRTIMQNYDLRTIRLPAQLKLLERVVR